MCWNNEVTVLISMVWGLDIYSSSPVITDTYRDTRGYVYPPVVLIMKIIKNSAISVIFRVNGNKSTRMYECATSVLDRNPETSRGKLWMCRTVFRVISLLSKYWRLKIVDVFLVTWPPFFKIKNIFNKKFFTKNFQNSQIILMK